MGRPPVRGDNPKALTSGLSSVQVIWFIFVPYSAHARTRATISSTLCSERVFILSILGLMKLHVDIIHALSLK